MHYSTMPPRGGGDKPPRVHSPCGDAVTKEGQATRGQRRWWHKTAVWVRGEAKERIIVWAHVAAVPLCFRRFEDDLKSCARSYARYAGWSKH